MSVEVEPKVAEHKPKVADKVEQKVERSIDAIEEAGVGCLKVVLSEWLLRDVVGLVVVYYWLPYHQNRWLLRALQHYFVSAQVTLTADLNLRVGRAHLVLVSRGGGYTDYRNPLSLATVGLLDDYLYRLWFTPHGYFHAENKRIRLRFRKRNAADRHGKRHGDDARHSRLILSGLEIQNVPIKALQTILDNEQLIEKWCRGLYNVFTRNNEQSICSIWFFTPFSPSWRRHLQQREQRELWLNRKLG